MGHGSRVASASRPARGLPGGRRTRERTLLHERAVVTADPAPSATSLRVDWLSLETPRPQSQLAACMSSPLTPCRSNHHHPRRPVTADRRLRFHGSQGDGHGGEGEGQHVGCINLGLLNSADMSCSSSLVAVAPLLRSCRSSRHLPGSLCVRGIRPHRRVAKLKTEHKELKARFERAKSEGQLRVSPYLPFCRDRPPALRVTSLLLSGNACPDLPPRVGPKRPPLIFLIIHRPPFSHRRHRCLPSQILCGRRTSFTDPRIPLRQFLAVSAQPPPDGARGLCAPRTHLPPGEREQYRRVHRAGAGRAGKPGGAERDPEGHAEEVVGRGEHAGAE